MLRSVSPWETGRRRFYSGEKLETAVFISNDDDQFRDFHNLQLTAIFADRQEQALAEWPNFPMARPFAFPLP